MGDRVAHTSRHASREGRCQVREKEIPCLARPVVELSMYVENVDPMLDWSFQTRTVQACEPHAAVLRRRYGSQIVAVRPIPPPGAPDDH